MSSGATIEDQAAIDVERMISIPRLFGDAPSHVTLCVLPWEFSKAVQLWTQTDRRVKTDEAQLGHRTLHGDSSAVNTSSQSIHSKASFRFITSSAAPIPEAE